MKKKITNFLQKLYCRYQDDEVPAMGAQLTYYLILAFFPFLIFLISVINFTPLTSDTIIQWVMAILPRASFQTVVDVLKGIQESNSPTLLSIGMIATIWSATSGVSAIIKALNKAYDAEETRSFWKVKGMSLLFTFILLAAILLSFGMLIFGEIIGKQLFDFLSISAFFAMLWSFAKIIIPLFIMFFVFVFLYTKTPNRHLTMKAVWPGALFSTIGWIGTSLLFSLYVNNFGSYTKTYGSIGGIIVLLTWLYISSIIIIIGGEINATLTFDKEGELKPSCKQFALPSPAMKLLHKYQKNIKREDTLA